MKVTIADRNVSGAESAELLLSDFAAATPGATITIDSADAWAGVVWRIGRGAIKVLVDGRATLSADEALQIGLIDQIAEDAADWRERSGQGRSALALDSAATLLRSRGGDALERAEFARLFAAGEPQRGLRAFLSRQRPPF